MTNKEAKDRIKKLKDVINYHRRLYHVEDRQEISDAALDSLKKELFDLEKKFPEFITADSPTQRVGGEPLEKFEKTEHSELMISLNDAFLKDDMHDWQERFSKLLPNASEIDFYCELKIDGLAIELIYENGFLKIGSTRGNGKIGENVTQNLKTVEAIPLKLRSEEEVIKELEKDGLKEIVKNIRKKGLKKVITRGEVFITKREFEKINKVQMQKELPAYANPRNIAAGSIRQLDPKITAERHLDSFAYDLLTDFGQTTHEQKHKILKALGFKINKNNKYCKLLEDVLKFREKWISGRKNLDYDIDGAVVIINNNRIFERLGIVGKTPRGAIAFKFPQSQSATKVLDIKIQVGRTGAITPVAILEPVGVSGITISRATLHNEDEIRRLGLKIGDTVVVGRAGDVIPEIVKVLTELRTGKEKDFKMPLFCPSCGSKLKKIEGENLWKCVNQKCFARQRRNFYHFVSRPAFNIEGLGPKIIDKLLDEGLAQDPGDLFLLKEGDVVPLERFAEKSAKNLIVSISGRKEISLPRFIYALGIRNVGEETAIDLAERFGSIKRIKEAKLEEFDLVSNIGPVVAKSIYEWFKDKNNLKFLSKLEKSVDISNQKIKSESQKLKGKIFVLTGSLDTLERSDAKARIRELGGEVSESVSQKTNYVVTGKEAGSKLEKAKKIGVKVIGEEEFLKLMK